MDSATHTEKASGMKLTETQMVFESHMSELGLGWQREYKFYHGRKWRSDYLVWDPKPFTRQALVEFEGGAWTRGRHVRGKGFIADLEKYNMASAIGLAIFRFTPQQVKSGEAKEFIRKWL